jgi:prophage DNA circulation protein
MSFTERLLTPAYTSPSGIRQEFFYSTGLEKSFEHKLDRYEFADLDVSYFQDLGLTSDVLPMQVKIKGPDYDLDAKNFEALLKEKGQGILEHPIHGTKNVVIGSVRRFDDPINAGGFATFDIAFFETDELQPAETIAFAAELADQQNILANEASAASFANTIKLRNILDQINFQETYRNYIGLVESALAKVAAIQGEIAIAFNQVLGDILNNLDTLIETPLQLAQQTQFLIQLPLQATESFSERFTSYAELLEDVLQLDGDGVSFLESRDINVSLLNDTLISELFGSAAINAVIQSASLSSYTIRTDALTASESVTTEFNKLTEILDRIQTKYENEIFFDQYFSQSQNYNEMRTLLLTVIKDIQKRLLSLAIEKKFNLTLDKHYIDVCGSEYGKIDDETLQFFQDTNNIHGDDFFILNKGREITVYV